ncbi:MAG: Gfo/Idh/MocA family oxidoreductase [Clostridia bacterium]|nr:Gfo/Idh/MocA family oxidoreductase [Clostridia bacterium]
MAKLKIGVFGGYRGHTMINVLFNHDDAELVAVCDKYEPILENITKEGNERGMNIATYTDFDEFIKHDMDAVVLANYATEHATYAIRCLKAGKHVMSEVLPCETMAQAVELIETVEETGLVYTYAENYCYMRHAFEMWHRYKRGDIGEVTYIEGEYVHDCTAIWPQITYGDPDHWRNRMHPTFYCTHSIGPMLTMTGLRPVQVVGFETPLHDKYKDIAITRGAGIEIVTLENGAIARSVHGDLKREPCSYNYMIYGQKGMMEGDRFPNKENSELMHVYLESDKFCKGDWEDYNPEPPVEPEKAKKFGTHGGSDFYATHFFIEKILGRPQGEWAIDVYTAVDMGICGLLAYKSILDGNVPVKVPNLRNKEERDAFRNDHACTTPWVAGDQLLPRSSHPYEPVPESTYKRHEELWKSGTNLEYGTDFEIK